ncbi:hypothetical protein PHYBOEH_007473 [Phytophthora boehmeriae]|uniref:Membrane-associated protein n=1 Tax=Phytophthora boehmeriae TaxID=109152 RepID=A0A8T1X7D5_9STRA|nr:hypothetical protein PHYBOEH_007473 [Phytophthora boehmeriae]
MTTGCRRCRRTAGRSSRTSINRSLVTVLLLLCVMQAAAATSDYVMDGATTYCWAVDTSIYSNTVSSSVGMVSAQGDGCPVQLSLDFPSGDVYAYDSVDISWNATVRSENGNIPTNDLGVTSMAAGLDRISQKYYQVTASRLRTCLIGVDCNPVTTGSQLTENTTNIPMNFTDNLAEFESSELSFDAAGTYALLAHLILPSSTPTTKRFDYAVFLKVEVLSRSSATTSGTTTNQPYSESTTSDSGSSGVSTEVICVLIIGGIVVVALAVIGFITLRSRIERPNEATGSKRNAKGRGMFGFSAGTSGTGNVAVVSEDGDEEFAMLSIHEVSMRRNSTYLSALARGRRSDAPARKKEGSPIQFAGPMCRQGVSDEERLSAGDITPQSIVIETPATGRGNYTDMAGLENTPKQLPPNAPPHHILFNDISEDEVDSSGQRTIVGPGVRAPNLDQSTSSTVTDLNLTAVSVRLKQHGASVDQGEIMQVKEEALTADDLRASEAQGPMALSDLYASQVKNR